MKVISSASVHFRQASVSATCTVYRHRVQQQVRGLDIAMQDAQAVRIVDRLRYLSFPIRATLAKNVRLDLPDWGQRPPRILARPMKPGA